MAEQDRSTGQHERLEAGSVGIKIPTAVLVPLLSVFLGGGAGTVATSLHDKSGVTVEAHAAVLARLDKAEGAIVALQIEGGRVDTRLDGFASALSEIKASVDHVQTGIDELRARRGK